MPLDVKDALKVANAFQVTLNLNMSFFTFKLSRRFFIKMINVINGLLFASFSSMVKFKVICFRSIFLFLCSFSFAQNDVAKEFMQHVKLSNHEGVRDLCSDFVEIETDRYDETTSKSKVGFILEEFFGHHPPKTFEYTHVGTSPGGAKYAIASYFTKQGKEFLVVVKFKIYGEKLLIDTIKFSKE